MAHEQYQNSLNSNAERHRQPSSLSSPLGIVNRQCILSPRLQHCRSLQRCPFIQSDSIFDLALLNPGRWGFVVVEKRANQSHPTSRHGGPRPCIDRHGVAKNLLDAQVLEGVADELARSLLCKTLPPKLGQHAQSEFCSVEVDPWWSVFGLMGAQNPPANEVVV